MSGKMTNFVKSIGDALAQQSVMLIAENYTKMLAGCLHTKNTHNALLDNAVRNASLRVFYDNAAMCGEAPVIIVAFWNTLQ